jgi:hypothetical protein
LGGIGELLGQEKNPVNDKIRYVPIIIMPGCPDLLGWVGYRDTWYFANMV